MEDELEKLKMEFKSVWEKYLEKEREKARKDICAAYKKVDRVL